MDKKRKKQLIQSSSVLVVVLLIGLLINKFIVNAATNSKTITDYDWGYMWWMSNDASYYDWGGGSYNYSWSGTPKYPEDKYSRWCYEEGPMSSSEWTSYNIQWAENVGIEKGDWPYGLPNYPNGVEYTDGQGWWGQGVWNHYRKPCVVYYKRSADMSITLETKDSIYNMGKNNSIDIDLNIKGEASIDAQHINDKATITFCDYVVESTGKKNDIINNNSIYDANKLPERENPQTFQMENTFTLSINRSDLKPGDNKIKLHGRFDLPIRCGDDFESSEDNTVEGELEINVKVKEDDSPIVHDNKPNLRPTDIKVKEKGKDVSTVFSGKNYEAVITIKNNGATEAGKSNTALHVGDDYIGKVATSAIKKGGETKVTIPFKSPKTGSIKLTATADWDNDVIESDENDNTISMTTLQYIPPKPSKIPPICTVKAREVVVVGQSCPITVTGKSEDWNTTWLQAGYTEICDQDFAVIAEKKEGAKTTFSASENNKTTRFSTNYTFTEEGEYTVFAYVKDSNGEEGNDVATIRVIEPVPHVNVQDIGTRKVNTKITIDASSSNGGAPGIGIDWTKAVWEIQPLEESYMDNVRIQTHTEGSTDGTILLDSSRGISNSLNGLSKFDMLFKEPGKYKIKCTLTNNYRGGRTASQELILTIMPNVPPIANFKLASTYLQRNSQGANGFMEAIQTLTDEYSMSNVANEECSYSIDNDPIDKRIWLYAFDVNNNGTYKDDNWYVWDSGSWRLVGDYEQAKNIDIDNVNDNNYTTVQINSPHVGKYAVNLIIREGFCEPYIPQFIDKSELLTASTFDE